MRHYRTHLMGEARRSISYYPTDAQNVLLNPINLIKTQAELTEFAKPDEQD